MQPEPSGVGDQSLLVNSANDTKAPVAFAPGSDKASDIAQLREENEQLKASIRDAAAHRQITGELERVGARSPELSFAAVKPDLQFADDDDAVVNVAAIVERLRRNFPEQFGADRPTGSIDAGAGLMTTSPINREALAKMKPVEIAKLDWEDVKRALAQG